MNNSTEDVICYYDNSLAKYVIINKKTGFSSYLTKDRSERQMQIKRHKTDNRIGLQIHEKDTTDPKEDNNSVDIQRLLNTNHAFNGCPHVKTKWQLNDCNNNDSTDRHTKTLFKTEWSLRADMRVNESIKLDNYLVTKGMLRVIGQMDKKFIICLDTNRNLLLAFDQHAVHERIRYEVILNNLYDIHKNVKSYPLLPPIIITIQDIDDQNVFNDLQNNFEFYRKQIKRKTGFEVTKKSPLIVNAYQFCVTQVPQCLSDSLDIQTIGEIIKDSLILMRQQSQRIVKSDDESSCPKLIPKLMERLQTKACRGAIRFGDALRLHDCNKLIDKLSDCKNCFRCAHGRPSVTPLAYIPKLS